MRAKSAKHAWRWWLGALASCGLYMFPNRFGPRCPRQVPSLAIDRAIPLLPWTVSAYGSLYPLLALQPWLLDDPDRLRRLAWRIIAANLIAAPLFWWWPTYAPRPEAPAQGLGAKSLRLLWRIDAPTNACPSLHTAFAILVLMAHWRRQGRTGRAIAAWCAAIILATLTTKQHQTIDAIGGAALAWLIQQTLPAESASLWQTKP